MKKLVHSLTIAFDALRINKLRSALTMLGIIIGVAAVIAMVAVGDGATAAGSLLITQSMRVVRLRPPDCTGGFHGRPVRRYIQETSEGSRPC